MYDPEEDEQSPYMQEAADAAKPGKYGANESETSRLANMAQDRSSLKKPLPMSTSYSSFSTETPNSAQAQYGPDQPGRLADLYDQQADLHKMGDTANPADDTPSPTIAQASGTGKYGDKGASAGDILSLFGGGI